MSVGSLVAATALWLLPYKAAADSAGAS
jgi:hypothetical protein